MLVMLANKHTRNSCSFSAPSNHAATGVPAQDALARTPLWSTMMEPYLSANGHQDPKLADGNNSRRLALMAMARGHSILGQSSPCLVTDGIQMPKTKTPRIPPNMTLPFLVCLASKPRGNPLQAQVAPDGQRNYSANPPKPKSHLFLARVHPPNLLWLLRLVSQNLRWLLRNPQRNLLVSHHFSFFTPINFSSPFLPPSPACTATPCYIIIINDTPIGSPPSP
ncbi:hypothetical protein O181_089029 [Austropuccinia psidii MF-1]|uniref:Uncharacterized protein n=1 Tax=Austropuccinia psidii MF-1 TaxID=1389203 RepID=A0A9Q3ISR9_9BASI|nr:hypothetical protein [Austropuccinia psidii MF-1]